MCQQVHLQGQPILECSAFTYSLLPPQITGAGWVLACSAVSAPGGQVGQHACGLHDVMPEREQRTLSEHLFTLLAGGHILLQFCAA